MAGAIAESARHGTKGEFRNLDPAMARVVLVQSAPRLLPAMPEILSRRACDCLRELGVEVRLKSRVEDVKEDHVIVNGDRIDANNAFWAAGVAAS